MRILLGLALFTTVSVSFASENCPHLFLKPTKSLKYQQAAEEAGLIYLTEFPSGISPSRDRRRFEKLDVPPSSKNIWFSPIRNSHIQATGFDSSGKKQYFYHPRWMQIRNEIKYGRLKSFGESLPAIRHEVKKQLSRAGLSKERVMAAIIRLLDLTAIRIGDEENAINHKTYGLTTMTRRHLVRLDDGLALRFVGKANQEHEIRIRDQKVLQVIEEAKQERGVNLFKYRSDDGGIHNVSASDINDYLKSLSGLDISAKDFRTWVGTVTAAEVLFQTEIKDGQKAIAAAATASANKLGNTKKIAIESYIDPRIITAYREGKPFWDAFDQADGDSELATLILLGN